jgi:hypothetical protein
LPQRGRAAAVGHQLPLADADSASASDGDRPFGRRGGVAVTGQYRSFR